jgi:hypothetical protein
MNIFGGEENTMLGGASDRKSLFSHVFSSTDEGKAEMLNTVQYAALGVIPIVGLNKLVQRFVPDADPEKSSVEIAFEIMVQIIVMFGGIILIHRLITYLPTYSGFRYEGFNLTTVILAFLMIVLSIQTKMGIKVNILTDRLGEMWNGPSDEKPKRRGGSRGHAPSQADTMDTIFPPNPLSSAPSKPAAQPITMRDVMDSPSQGPMAANTMLGGGFGSFF